LVTSITGLEGRGGKYWDSKTIECQYFGNYSLETFSEANQSFFENRKHFLSSNLAVKRKIEMKKFEALALV
jgi:hypothetical protein